MKILIVNSNTTPSVTSAFTKTAQGFTSAETELISYTAPFGPRAIQGRADAVIAAHATLTTIIDHADSVDAAIVACFSDPGLLAAREVVSIPVVGIAEASFLTACMVGARFSIITVAPSTVDPIRDLVASYGLSSRFAGVRALNRSVLNSHADPEETLKDFEGLLQLSVQEDGANVVIVGGAVTGGMAKYLAEKSTVPVLDCVECAVRQAELLARIRDVNRPTV